jgi:hypothetical protein
MLRAVTEQRPKDQVDSLVLGGTGAWQCRRIVHPNDHGPQAQPPR